MNGLATFPPRLTDPPNYLPTGNLSVSLPEIAQNDGSIASLGVVLASCAGVLTAHGGPGGLAAPFVRVGGESPELRLSWRRDGDWLPHFTALLPTGELDGQYLAPVGERGATLRLRYQHHSRDSGDIELGWCGSWNNTTVEHLRSKPVAGVRAARDDSWTGSRVVTETTGLPLLALAWRAGPGMHLTDDGSGTGWRASTSAVIHTGDELTADIYIGVAPEPDGAATTALHLRRRGFDDLLADTLAWLAHHRLPVTGPLGATVNANLFFSWFYAQADCLDDGRAVLLTSRSPHYYVCGAFWSRDAYCWTFPALLLVDVARARHILVSTLLAGGVRLPDHALYVTGTSLYPGFELDQAAAPVLAVARYVSATDDWSVMAEPGVGAVLVALLTRVEAWRHPSWALYATFLLPTDDPTDYPYVTTANALLAAAFDAFDDLVEGARVNGVGVPFTPPWVSGELRARATTVRAALTEHLVVDSDHGPMWAWACDADGHTEIRDEPPLGLLILPFWGVEDWDAPLHIATRSWMSADYEHQYPGPFGGAGAPHFPYPSGFDLANRLLDLDSGSPDPLAQLLRTPMDQGLACESWDPTTGRVATGAAMASMAGLLVWTAWSRMHGRTRWDQAEDLASQRNRLRP